VVFIGNPIIPKLRKESMQYEGPLILEEGILVVMEELEGVKIGKYLRALCFLMDVQVRLSCFQKANLRSFLSSIL
jgi:hypothetical protein